MCQVGNFMHIGDYIARFYAIEGTSCVGLILSRTIPNKNRTKYAYIVLHFRTCLFWTIKPQVAGIIVSSTAYLEMVSSDTQSAQTVARLDAYHPKNSVPVGNASPLTNGIANPNVSTRLDILIALRLHISAARCCKRFT